MERKRKAGHEDEEHNKNSMNKYLSALATVHGAGSGVGPKTPHRGKATLIGWIGD